MCMGLSFVDGNDWLLPQLEGICFSSWRGISFAMLRAVPSRGPAASMWCHPTDNEYELHRAHWNNPSNSMELHVISSQSHTWKQPLLRRQAKFYREEKKSCKRLASCQAAHLPFLWACKQGNHPQATQAMDEKLQLCCWMISSKAVHEAVSLYASWMSFCLACDHFSISRCDMDEPTWEHRCLLPEKKKAAKSYIQAVEWSTMEATRQSSWSRQIFWATQARNADLLSRMETQTALVASHAKLATRK